MRLSLLGIIFVVVLAAGCGGNILNQPTLRPPTATVTPRSTALPTVGTQAPLGSADRPYHIALTAPDPNASGSDLQRFLTNRNHNDVTFTVDVLASNAEVLSQLCSEKPTFAWVDGPTLLAAQAQGCGVPVLKYQQGTEKRTSVKSDLIVRSGDKDSITTVLGFRGKDFCRISGADVASWVLPSLALRAGGVNPALDLKGIKEFADTDSLLQAVADGVCAGAGIPAGTLNSFSPRLPTGKTLTVLVSTPELPLGGLAVSSTVPKAVADDVIDLFTSNQDRLRGLISADDLVKVSANEFADFQKQAQNAGLNLKTLGQ